MLNLPIQMFFPLTVEVTKPLYLFFLGSIKFIFVINILNASAIGDKSFTLISSSAPFF